MYLTGINKNIISMNKGFVWNISIREGENWNNYITNMNTLFI